MSRSKIGEMTVTRSAPLKVVRLNPVKQRTVVGEMKNRYASGSQYVSLGAPR
jgi:hypothetical protein